MNQENDLLKFIENSKHNTNYKSEKYIFYPLKDKDGFIVYSKEKIHESKNLAGRNLKVEFKDVYDSLDWKKINKSGESYTYRYYFYKKISNAKKHATVVMMNPAFACSESNDNTINNIEHYLKKLKTFGSFDIINLYPIRMPNSSCLNKFINFLNLNEDETYSDFLLKFLVNSKRNGSTIIAAWGSTYHKKAKSLFAKKDDVNGFKCYAINDKTNSPKHFGSMAYNSERNKPAKLEAYEF